MPFLYLDSYTKLDIITNDGQIVMNTTEQDEYTLNDLHTNTGYDDHTNSGYSNHSNSGCNTHSQSYAQSGYDNHYSESYSEGYSNYDNHSDYGTYSNCSASSYYAHGNYSAGCSTHNNGSYSVGYDNHTNGCSNSGYDNHTNSGCSTHSNSGCSTHTNYTNNYAPVLSGVVSPSANTFNLSIPLSWSPATDQTASGQTAQTISYKLEYQYKSTTDTAFGTFTEIATVTTTSYTWDTSAMPAGEYKVKITAWDGLEWSATSLLSDILTVVHYTAPSWGTVLGSTGKIKKSEIDEVRTEVNKASEGFGLGSVVFVETIVQNQTKIKASHLTELRDKAQAVRTQAGHGAFGWTRSTISTNLTTNHNDLKDIRTLLEQL